MVADSAATGEVFDSGVADLLQGIAGRKVLRLAAGENLFVQGDAADSIYFVLSGTVKVSVVSAEGKVATWTLINPPSFVGEEFLAGYSRRNSTATTLETTTVVRVGKQAMLLAVESSPELGVACVESVLARGMALEEDLCNQFFNTSEKRLARTLLKLARTIPGCAATELQMPGLNHEALAEMVGTTRSRICKFMGKFRTLRLIDYEGQGRITVKVGMLKNLVLNDMGFQGKEAPHAQ